MNESRKYEVLFVVGKICVNDIVVTDIRQTT